MSRRVLIVVSAVLLGAAAPAGASTPPPPAPGTQTTPAAKPPAKPQRSWADAQIRLVVANGLMAPDVASFRPDDPLTRGALSALGGGRGRDVRAPGTHRLAAEDHRDRVLVRRLSIRLGRHERARRDAGGRQGP